MLSLLENIPCVIEKKILLFGDGMSYSYLLSPTGLNVSFSTIVFLFSFLMMCPLI